MSGNLNASVAQAAVNLRRSHPHTDAVEVLDLVFAGRAGPMAALGSLHPTTPFGQLLTTAFDPAMDPRDWGLIDSPTSPPGLLAVLWGIWKNEVVPKFAARYSLTL